MMRPAQIFLLPALLAAACGGPAAGGKAGVPVWPDSLPAAAAFGTRRGLTPVRTAIHAHSLYSYDACDRAPVDAQGRPNEACLARLRRAICRLHIGALFLTEHDRRLAEAESLDQALLRRGTDTPVLVAGHLAASRIACPGDPAGTLLFAGAENRLIAIGFDSLPAGGAEARRDAYNAETPGAAAAFRALGAVVLFPHTEEVALEEIATLGPDGLELFNPHAIFAPKHRRQQGLSPWGAFAELLPFYARGTRAHPDLALLPIFRAHRTALDKWDALLSDRFVFGFGASDAHENALPWPLADGERGDAYTRLLRWVANVVLVAGPDPVGAGDAAGLKDAIRRGRFFVVIEAWGTPAGFDFHLAGPDGTAEMGSRVPYRAGLRLIARAPAVSGLSPALPEPAVRLRLYRITPGRRDVVAESAGHVEWPVTGPGAYRVEVGIVPRHLTPYLGADADRYLREVIWIYSNPILVEPER
ncbi:MAG: hypothetical protein ABR559_02785 [Gemmatimonadota bacterium]